MMHPIYYIDQESTYFPLKFGQHVDLQVGDVCWWSVVSQSGVADALVKFQ